MSSILCNASSLKKSKELKGSQPDPGERLLIKVYSAGSRYELLCCLIPQTTFEVMSV